MQSVCKACNNTLTSRDYSVDKYGEMCSKCLATIRPESHYYPPELKSLEDLEQIDRDNSDE